MVNFPLLSLTLRIWRQVDDLVRIKDLHEILVSPVQDVIVETVVLLPEDLQRGPVLLHAGQVQVEREGRGAVGAVGTSKREETLSSPNFRVNSEIEPA